MRRAVTPWGFSLIKANELSKSWHLLRGVCTGSPFTGTLRSPTSLLLEWSVTEIDPISRPQPNPRLSTEQEMTDISGYAFACPARSVWKPVRTLLLVILELTKYTRETVKQTHCKGYMSY